MLFFQPTADDDHYSSGFTDSLCSKKKETNHNLRLILLAIRLQRPVKNLPSHLISAERITRKSLAQEYYSEGNSSSEEAAYKMAGRHLSYMDDIFGLEGNKSGFVMARRFETFRSMFEFWLETIGDPGRSDKRLHVMLQGLLRAIDNGFRHDPICVSSLARQLQKEYGHKNIRDIKEPLEELFSEETLSSYLVLYEDNDNTFKIGKEYDPLLLRWRGRNEVGDNHDISINLAMAGRIHALFEDHTRQLESSAKLRARIIAQAVRQSMIWQSEDGNMMIPYIFYREGEQGPLLLTLFNMEQGEYIDIPFESIHSVPDAPCRSFRPYEMPEALWMQFQQLAS
ncbi:hypothetical protein D8Y20_10820 [Mariprofundus sp. EBB-1]|uniref:hypothetical protein n=1 Tax=Mariprofundus sp. EBB-1 TaxID=2650971 RepID=UPI000EF1C6A1|nr:hypothetical protein [Mariprofundus sp. EBB-1]RLL50874.1 hypothetical protein D8Y20_10820 [Mariprofundus sp. EBB-1]